VGFSESDLLKGFSCPTEMLDESFFNLVGVQHAKAVLELFLDRFRAELEQCHGVASALEEIMTSELELNTVWSPAVGMCFRATSSGSTLLARRAAAEVLLHASAHGVSVDWEIQFARPHLFLWEFWLLPRCDYLSVSHVEGAASVVSRDEGIESRILFRRNANENRWESDSGGVPLPSVRTEHGLIVLLPAGILNPSDLDGLKNSPTTAPETALQESASAQGAFALLKDSLPSHSAWVTRVIRRVAAAEASALNYLKSIVPGSCSLAFISERQDALSQAETLVHEAAHNYYYLVSALGSPAEASSGELYYSPFVHMMRTFDRILSAYHAFANAYIFYRTCLDALPAHREVCAERMGHILKALRRAEVLIKDSKRLTATGTALLEPLMQELQNEH
jgi:HEXXH motif-containing protein